MLIFHALVPFSSHMVIFSTDIVVSKMNTEMVGQCPSTHITDDNQLPPCRKHQCVAMASLFYRP